jgi:glyoxylase-like metal-dependent hydrolase (beta-lactamase superfamily II)
MSRILPLEIKSDFGDRIVTIYPVLLCDNNNIFLFDAGFPGQTELFVAASKKNGINLERLTGIIITHHDYDHIGSLSEIRRRNKNVKIYASEIETDYISGKKKFINLERLESTFDALPEEEKQGALDFLKTLENIPPVAVDMVLKDNDLIPVCGGIRVVHTPGHLPGHICIYVEEFKTLIAGDAMRVINNKLSIPNPKFTMDMKLALKSLKKLLVYDIECIICYNGGEFRGDCKKAITDILYS